MAPLRFNSDDRLCLNLSQIAIIIRAFGLEFSVYFDSPSTVWIKWLSEKLTLGKNKERSR